MALPHDPRPSGHTFTRITHTALAAARTLTHLEFRVLIAMYEIANYQTLALEINRAELARLAGASRDKVNKAVRTLVGAGFLTLTNGSDQAQLNPAPLTPEGAHGPSGCAPSGFTPGFTPEPSGVTKRTLRVHPLTPQGSASAPSGVTPPRSPIRNGREEEKKREKREEDRSSRVRVCVREGRAEPAPEPEQPEPLVFPLDAVRDSIIAWGGGTIGGSAAVRVATVLYDLAEQYPIPDPSGTGRDASPISVCLAMVDLMRGLGADGPPPTSIARVRGYADAVLRDCAAEGRMPGQIVPITRVSRFEQQFEAEHKARLARRQGAAS